MVTEKEMQFSVGEIAKMTGLTVRTLQHYDNIGLLPSSGRTEGGRRFYQQSDLLKLEQIIFYRSLGISLPEIKAKLVETPDLPELERTLEGHLFILLRKIDSLHLAVSVLESSLEVIRNGKYPPWEMLVNLIHSLEGSSIVDWVDFPFSADLYTHLENTGLTTLSGAMDFYHTMRELMVEAVTLQKIGVRPEEARAQLLAKKWWDLVNTMTNGEDEVADDLAEVNENRKSWPEADKLLFEAAESFIEPALNEYFKKNKIEVPKALQ